MKMLLKVSLSRLPEKIFNIKVENDMFQENNISNKSGFKRVNDCEATETSATEKSTNIETCDGREMNGDDEVINSETVTTQASSQTETPGIDKSTNNEKCDGREMNGDDEVINSETATTQASSQTETPGIDKSTNIETCDGREMNGDDEVINSETAIAQTSSQTEKEVSGTS